MRRVDVRVIVIAALVVVVGVLAWSQSGVQDSSEHRSDSDGRQGTSALRQYAAALGHPTSQLDGFAPAPSTALLFVFTPTVRVTPGAAARVDALVAGGGVVVYASEGGNPVLDRALGVERRSGVGTESDLVATPGALAGVRSVAGAGSPTSLVPGPRQVVLLRDRAGRVAAIEERRGRGTLVALTDPMALANGMLDRADNGRLASDLISLAGRGGGVAFDERFHEPLAQGPESPLTGWLSTPWGAGLAWALLAVFAGLLLRGRAFGPRLALPGGGDRSAVEHVTAVGRLLRRSGASGATLDQLRTATRRALGRRYGIPGGPGFDAALAARAPADAEALTVAEGAAAGARGERPLLEAARRLHRLAHPAPTQTSTQQEET